MLVNMLHGRRGGGGGRGGNTYSKSCTNSSSGVAAVQDTSGIGMTACEQTAKERPSGRQKHSKDQLLVGKTCTSKIKCSTTSLTGRQRLSSHAPSYAGTHVTINQ